MKKAAIYARVSTSDQHIESQLCDLRQLAEQRGSGDREGILVVERVKSGMRRAKMEGRQIVRARLDVDREQVVLDRRSGMSLTQVAKKHNISRASVCRLMKEANENGNPAVLTPSVELAQQAGAGQ